MSLAAMAGSLILTALAPELSLRGQAHQQVGTISLLRRRLLQRLVSLPAAGLPLMPKLSRSATVQGEQASSVDMLGITVLTAHVPELSLRGQAHQQVGTTSPRHHRQPQHRACSQVTVLPPMRKLSPSATAMEEQASNAAMAGIITLTVLVKG